MSSKLTSPLAPATFAISPLGDRLVSQSLRDPKEFAFHSYPTRENGKFHFNTLFRKSEHFTVADTTKWREELIHTLLSSRDGTGVHKLFAGSNRESQLDLIDSAWEILESETGGGGSPRWALQYLQALLLVDT